MQPFAASVPIADATVTLKGRNMENEISFFDNKVSKTVLMQPVDKHDLFMIENEVALIREAYA